MAGAGASAGTVMFNFGSHIWIVIFTTMFEFTISGQLFSSLIASVARFRSLPQTRWLLTERLTVGFADTIACKISVGWLCLNSGGRGREGHYPRRGGLVMTHNQGVRLC